MTPLNFLTWRFQLSQLLQSMPAAPVPRTIHQGEEPERFIALMEGTLILSGSHPLTSRPPTANPAPAAAAAERQPPALAVSASEAAEQAEGEERGGEGAGEGVGEGAGEEEGEAGEEEEEESLVVESLPALEGIVLLQVKRYAATPLGVCARQVVVDSLPHRRPPPSQRTHPFLSPLLLASPSSSPWPQAYPPVPTPGTPHPPLSPWRSSLASPLTSP